MGRQFFGSVFEPLLNNGLNLAILQSFGNIEYFIEKLQIWERVLHKIVAHLSKIYLISYLNQQV